MGSRLLYGSPQLSVMVTVFPLILTVLSSTVTLETIAGTFCVAIVGNTVGVIVAIVVVVGTTEEVIVGFIVSVMVAEFTTEVIVVAVVVTIIVDITVGSEVVTGIFMEVIVGCIEAMVVIKVGIAVKVVAGGLVEEFVETIVGTTFAVAATTKADINNLYAYVDT